MDNRNNLGRQFTQRPQFGSIYPNTQYRGYTEEEGSPYGNPSFTRNPTMSNQPYHTSRYQGNYPYHREDKLNNVRFHGGQYSSSQYQNNLNQSRSQYQNNPYLPQRVEQYPGTGSHYQGNMYQSGPTSQYQGGMNQFNPTSQNQGGINQYGAVSQNQSNINHYGFQPQGGINQPGTTFQNQAIQSQPGQMNGIQVNDRDRINDLLASEKYLTEGYNISTFEATTPELQNTLKNILNETHNNRKALYQLMEQRGWYKAEKADQQQISQAYNQFNNYKSQLPFN